MKKLIIYIIFILIFCIASDCKKQPEDKPIYYLDQEIKDYTMFPVGSYCVYEDSLSNNIDTLKIINQETKIIDMSYESSKWQDFELHYTSSYFNDTIAGGGSAGSLESQGSCFYGEEGWVRFFSQKEPGYLWSNSLLYKSYYDSLNIRNKWYDSVKVFKLSYSYSDAPHYIIYHYYAKDIGLIKKEIPDSIVWELKNYHVNN